MVFFSRRIRVEFVFPRERGFHCDKNTRLFYASFKRIYPQVINLIENFASRNFNRKKLFWKNKEKKAYGSESSLDSKECKMWEQNSVIPT